MIQEQLSIFIPTFNRWKVLSETLKHTLKILPTGSTVRIINNNSNNKKRGLVEEIILAHSDIDCKIIDNPINVGAEANFLRCIELCTTPYVLILGDDDYLTDDFITHAERFINLEQAHQWGWINFQVKIRRQTVRAKNQVFDNPFHMARSSNNWAELMFISSSIFSTKLLRGGLLDAHQWQSTWSVLPIAILRGWEHEKQKTCAKTEYKFALSKDSIVSSTGHGDAHYNQVGVYQHLPNIEKVAFNTPDRHKTIKLAVRGSVKKIFKTRVLIKHFYSHVQQQTLSKSIVDYQIISKGLPYMVGIKSTYYRFYLTMAAVVAWLSAQFKKNTTY